MKWTFFILVLWHSCFLFSQPDYWYYLVFFNGCPVNHIPKGITIPDRDNKARTIINAIVDGNSYDQLYQKYPDSLDIKLDKLITGKVIERDQNGFKLLFPVLTSENRIKLQTIIHRQLSGSGFTIDSMIGALKQALPGNPEMIFHFLWSRIIDDCWWNLYNTTFHTDQGPPDIAFLVYPPHPCQCGTNSDYSPDNDMFAMSWSYNIFDELFHLPSTKSFFNLAKHKKVPESDRTFFLKHGLMDTEDHVLMYAYPEAGSLDRLCDSLKTIYVERIHGIFDYAVLSEIFHIPAEDLFILVSHEIAYELIKDLAEKKSILIPIIPGNNPDLDFKYLVSVRLHANY
jgi:hypothetical protein